MTIQFDSASLGVQLSADSHNMSEVGYLVDIMDGLPMFFLAL